LIFELLSFNGYNVQNFAILAEKFLGFKEMFTFLKIAQKNFWVFENLMLRILQF
jgi:hypothetical protein